MCISKSFKQGSILVYWSESNYIIIPPLPEGGGGYTVLPLSVLPSVQDICRRIFLSNCWWQKSDIWSQASYRYTILWVAFLDPSDSYFLFTDFVDFYTHWTYMLIFRCIFLSNYWWQESDIWSQASYRYAILWGAFLDPSDSYFLFAEERGYHKWALAHSSLWRSKRKTDSWHVFIVWLNAPQSGGAPYSRSRWRNFTNGNGTDSTSCRLYTGNRTLRFIIYLLFLP